MKLSTDVHATGDEIGALFGGMGQVLLILGTGVDGEGLTRGEGDAATSAS